MELLERVEREAEATERQAAAIRKLVEVARELGPEKVAELLGLPKPTNGNGHSNGNGHTITDKPPEPPLILPLAARDGKPLRGREAIRQIVREQPGLWSLARLRVEMKQRGWFVSTKAVEVAVTRLMALGECRRVGKGLYKFPAPVKEADA